MKTRFDIHSSVEYVEAEELFSELKNSLEGKAGDVMRKFYSPMDYFEHFFVRGS